MQLNSASRSAVSISAIGFIQGLIYWILIEIDNSGVTSNAIQKMVMMFTLVTGLSLQLGWGSGPWRRAWPSAALGAAIAVTTLWVWLQMTGDDTSYRFRFERVPSLITGSLILGYIALPFLLIFWQSGRLKFPYTELFRHSWNNIFLVSLAGLFTGLYWGLIALWAGLFKLIGIAFFSDIFYSSFFAAVTLPVAFGFGLSIARDKHKIVNTLRDLALGIFKALLPLLSVITIAFVASLPFTGLAPLWETRWASTILLLVLFHAVLFINAVYQDGEGQVPYQIVLRRLVEAMILTLPVFAIIALYSIQLRIGQYGLTPGRIHAAIIALFAFAYSAAYVLAVLRPRDGWMQLIRPLNIVISIVMAATVFLLNTPVVDVMHISANSQVSRLIGSKVDADKFDYKYLQFKLGRPGRDALKQLEQLESHPQLLVIRTGVKNALSANYYSRHRIVDENNYDVIAKHTTLLGKSPPPPTDFWRALGRTYYGRHCAKNEMCAVYGINADEDAAPEWLVLVRYGSNSSHFYLYLYDINTKGAWGESAIYRQSNFSFAELVAAIKKGNLTQTPSRYQDLVVEGKLLPIQRITRQ